MTKQKAPKDTRTSKRRKLSHEILGLLGAALAIAVFLFAFLSMTATTIAENYCDYNALTLTRSQAAGLNTWIYGVSLVTSTLFFIVLFLFLLGQKITYIRNITEGVEALRTHRMDFVMPLEGNNELTQLAESINYLSATEKQIREKERALQEEKEQFIRTLSHDIRTPLTSIMSYSELMLSQKSHALNEGALPDKPEKSQECTLLREKEQLGSILKKAEQIKELTDILLDGGRRSPEFFEDARLLMEQLATEMEEVLEGTAPTDNCCFSTDFSKLQTFSGAFDVGELRRIFDNLTSNIMKYADLTRPVNLAIYLENQALVIKQENFKKVESAGVESHRVGLASIRHIAHNYGGTVRIQQDEARFVIEIILSNF